jgi:cyanophycinase
MRSPANRLLPKLVAILSFLAACAAPPATAPVAGSQGRLLVIGGALSKQNDDVYSRLLKLAMTPSGVRLVIATAASGDEKGAAESLQKNVLARSPLAHIDVISRDTSTDATVAAIRSSNAMFFTGGDQKRITDRYRPEDRDTPEWIEMKQLLARGGVIAGNSAGDAMMGDVMFFTGRSAQALGIPRQDLDPEDELANRTGPQIGNGMRLVSWILTDSHFWERDRVGRLVAALEQSGQRLGIGVGENAAVEFDLATGDCIGISENPSLLVDAGSLVRDGVARRNCRALVVKKGARVRPVEWSRSLPPPSQRPAGQSQAIAVGDDDKLATQRLFEAAEATVGGTTRLRLDGWSLVAWRDGDVVTFDVEVGQ